MKSFRYTPIKRNSGVIYFEIFNMLIILIIISLLLNQFSSLDLQYIILLEISFLIILLLFALAIKERLYTYFIFRKFIYSRREFNPISEWEIEWPKVYFKISHTDNQRIFFIKNDGSTASQLLLDSIEPLAHAFKTIILDISTERDGIFIFMELRKFPQAVASMSNIAETTDSIVHIANGIQWDLNSHPHGIIVGRTGEGKSVLAQMIIRSLPNFTIYYIDPKSSYKTRQSLEGTGVKYINKAENIINTLQSLNKEMIMRGDAIEEYVFMKEEFLNKDFSKILIVFDEMGAVGDVPDMPKNGHNEIIKAVRSLALQGRETNFHLLALCQRADSKNFGDGAVRGQFSFRCAMGTIQDKEAYNMVFPDTDYTPLTRHEKGAGLIWLPEFTRPREFVLPRFEDL